MTAGSSAEQSELEDRLRERAASGRLSLPLPGGGRTNERFRALRCLGAEDLSLARLAEAHTDATAILAEAGRDHDPRVLFGVWASGGAPNRVDATRTAAGWVLRGRRFYCSGAALLDRALLPVSCGRDELLLSVDLRDRHLVIDGSDWRTPALAATATATVTFDGLEVARHDLVGGPGFYLDRPGFWIGSVGVAAVWAGGAMAVADRVRADVGDDPHALAHLGAIDVACWTIGVALDAVAAEIDLDPAPPPDAGMARALRIRHLVERSSMDIVDRAARALGPGPLVRDGDHARRVAELQLYVRQTHADHDLEAVGRHARIPPR